MNLHLSFNKFPCNPSKGYDRLSSSTDSFYTEDCIEPKFVSATSSRSQSRILYGIIVFLATLIIIIGALALRLYRTQGHGMAPEPISCSCGSSISEAKTLGCKYDSLSACWLPPQCRDDELTAEFERSGDGPDGAWSYWADKNTTIPINQEQLSRLADLPKSQAVAYSTFGWHVAHCAFYWRKEFRMRAKGLMLESRYDKESHVEHCYPIFIAGIPLDSPGAVIGVRLGGDQEEEEHDHHMKL